MYGSQSSHTAIHLSFYMIVKLELTWPIADGGAQTLLHHIVQTAAPEKPVGRPQYHWIALTFWPLLPEATWKL